MTLTWQAGWWLNSWEGVATRLHPNQLPPAAHQSLNKKAPRVKKPGTKPSGPAEGGCGATLYAETIQMCGYNMSTALPFSNLSSPVASKSELFH